MPDQPLLLFILGQLATGAGVYAAIRADLREALVRCRLLEARVSSLEAAR